MEFNTIKSLLSLQKHKTGCLFFIKYKNMHGSFFEALFHVSRPPPHIYGTEIQEK